MPHVRKHTDLIAWQLCQRIRTLVLLHTRTGPGSRDYDWRRQVRKAARSSCYLTSEGFYRYSHGEFGHYLNLAHGSIGESLDQIDEGLQEQYFTAAQHLEMKRLCLRAIKCNVRLRQSWETGPEPPPLGPPSAAEQPAERRRRARARRAADEATAAQARRNTSQRCPT